MQKSEWIAKYKPKEFSFGSESGVHVNTHEDGVTFTRIGKSQPGFGEVVRAAPDVIWTELEVNGLSYISSGFHVVNAVGYFLTESPFEGDIEIELWGADDEIDHQKELFFHFLDEHAEKLSPGLKSALLSFIQTRDASVLSQVEPARRMYPGFDNAESMAEADSALETLKNLGFMTEEHFDSIIDLMTRGSFPLPPAPRANGPQP